MAADPSGRSRTGYEPRWQDRLDPFGHLFVNLDDHLESMLQAMPDAELTALQAATTRVNTGNCWCYVYDANPFVQRAILKEQGRRKVLFMADEPEGHPSDDARGVHTSSVPATEVSASENASGPTVAAKGEYGAPR